MWLVNDFTRWPTARGWASWSVRCPSAVKFLGSKVDGYPTLPLLTLLIFPSSPNLVSLFLSCRSFQIYAQSLPCFLSADACILSWILRALYRPSLKALLRVWFLSKSLFISLCVWCPPTEDPSETGRRGQACVQSPIQRQRSENIWLDKGECKWKGVLFTRINSAMELLKYLPLCRMNVNSRIWKAQVDIWAAFSWPNYFPSELLSQYSCYW